MRRPNSKLRSTAIAALLSLPLAGGAAFAQETGQTDESTTQDQGTAQQQPSQTASDSGQSAGDQQQDSVVATVGEAEIRGSDVMTVIGMLPPHLQSQPQEVLVPIALEQLILRELILEEARSENLGDDPEVVALVDNSTPPAADDAMVQVWIDREMAGVVTDETVQQVYDQTQSQGAQDLPPLAEVRPQIEQHLRQQAMQEIQTELREDADIVVYDLTGQPVEQQTGGGESSGGTSGEQSNGDAADSSDGAGEEAQD